MVWTAQYLEGGPVFTLNAQWAQDKFEQKLGASYLEMTLDVWIHWFEGLIEEGVQP